MEDSELNVTGTATGQSEIRACEFVFEVPDEVIFATISSIKSVLTALCNALMLLAIWKTPALRKPSHILIANLALADFLVGSVTLIFEAMDAGFKRESRLFFCIYSLIKRAITFWLGSISLFTLFVISIDRVLVVKLKATYCLIVTARRVKLVLALWWIVFGGYTCFLASWNIFTFKTILRQMAIILCLLVTAIAVSYIISAKELTKLASQVSVANNLDSQDSNASHARTFDALKYRKSLKTMIIVFFATILFYVPLFCISAIKSFGNLPSNSLNLHFRIAESIALANSLINPLIYVWRMGDLRQAVYQTLRKLKNWKH